MLSSAALALVGFSISAAAVQIQSFNPSFSAAGIQGCIAVEENAAGEPLIIHDCNTEPDLANQDWSVSFYTRQPAGPQQIKVFGDKCIDVTGGVNADGTKLQIWDCADGNTNQLWTSFNDNSLQWSGTDKCIDLSDGSITDGNVLQIWTCASGSQNQGWIGEKNPDTTEVNNLVASNIGFDGFCIAAASNTDGAAVALAGCENANFHDTFPNGNITWIVPVPPLSGPIKTFDNKCIDVPNGSNVNGVKLQIWTCAEGNTNQLFKPHEGFSQLEWVGSGKCLDLTDGNFTNGTLIQLWDCAVPDNNFNQDWFRAGVSPF
ncbi:ricin B lectin domain-containing protein [Mycena albidolilacea]|uniref:Ricin B lectin domain-containing protein n=1 Tax=Mycena albidolilacea TaxID=1033008 RepID=A0AAD7AH91_9AGAR|nr:ricin B lectin domain-containing protein [Mycena albidolilacea]